METQLTEDLEQLDVDTFEIEDIAEPEVDLAYPPWGCSCSSCSSCCS
jgi:hypothetical protein